MSTDVKKHTSIAAGEVPSRAGLAAAFFGVDDFIPVANATEAGQVATAAATAGQVLASNPIVVARADAPGMHRAELSNDGSVWRPLSAVMHFTNDTARDSWTTSNSALLVAYDECISNSLRYVWSGSVWLPQDFISYTPTVSGFTGTTVATWRMNGLHEAEVRFRITLTAGSPSNPNIGLPVNAVDANVEHLMSAVALIPTAGSEAVGHIRKSANNQVVVYTELVSGSNVFINNIGATVPFTWASGYILAGTFSYAV